MGDERVALWHVEEKRFTSGFASPKRKNLDKYLKSHPAFVVYVPVSARKNKVGQETKVEETKLDTSCSPTHGMRDPLDSCSGDASFSPFGLCLPDGAGMNPANDRDPALLPLPALSSPLLEHESHESDFVVVQSAQLSCVGNGRLS